MTNNMLALFNSLVAGPVPCKVNGLSPSNPGSDDLVVVTVTANRLPYRKGEILSCPARHVWPRDCARLKRGAFGQTYIVGPYDWKERLKNNSVR